MNIFVQLALHGWIKKRTGQAERRLAHQAVLRSQVNQVPHQ